MSKPHLRRFGAVVAYDGSDFAGFQRQKPDFRTVQGEIETGLALIGRQPVAVTAAGRTDAGVHATGQVIAFELPWRHDTATLQTAINANLPADIVIRHLFEPPSTFHPRFDARRRQYRYLVDVLEPGLRWPFTRRTRWQIHRPLNVDRMNQAAGLLIGTHDLATFGTPPQGNNTVREIFRAEWEARAAGRELVFTIEGNAFLFRMVRTVVGTLVQVGQGSWSGDRFQAAFDGRDRSLAAAPAPPNGLYLSRVTYENRLEIIINPVDQSIELG